MTQYEKKLPVTVAFPPQQIKFPLGRAISESGYKQVRISETEKERFVTYYFNGLHEEVFKNEDRVIIPSVKVATYDLKPEMRAYEILQTVLDFIKNDTYDFYVVNFAQADMVAHTGVIKAGIRACEVTDECVKKVTDAILAKDGTCFITADHGNVEEMIDPVTGGIDTEHSTYPVPFICIANKYKGITSELPSGMLADVAPTILAEMGVPVPTDMNGRNLLAFIQKGGTQ